MCPCCIILFLGIGAVLPGVALSSSDITEGDVLDTVLGAPLVADLPVIKSTSDEVEVVQADVVACGGIIHVIDGVLLPITEEELDILEGAPEEETPEEDLPIGPGMYIKAAIIVYMKAAITILLCT